MNLQYRAGFAVVIAETTRRLLVLRSRVERGKWKLPGGNIEAGESVLVGLAREINEELDRRLEVGTVLITRLEPEIDSITTVGVAYVPTVAAFEFRPHLSCEHDMHGWVTVDAVDQYDIDTHLDKATFEVFLRNVASLCRPEFAGRIHL